MQRIKDEESAEHYAIRRLQEDLRENPSSRWHKEWIDAYTFFCGCKECLALLKKNDIDMDMLDSIFG